MHIKKDAVGKNEICWEWEDCVMVGKGCRAVPEHNVSNTDFITL